LPGAPAFLERECATAEGARELEHYWVAQLAGNLAYQRGRQKEVSKHRHETSAMQLKKKRLEEVARKQRNLLVLTDSSKDWPPPTSPRSRAAPDRQQTHAVLALRSKQKKKNGSPDGYRPVAKRLGLSWRQVKWVADNFEL
jgi:hypothetical protein